MRSARLPLIVRSHVPPRSTTARTREPGRYSAFQSRSRTTSAPGGSRRPHRRAFWKAMSRRITQPWLDDLKPPEPSSSARRTATSSPWVRRRRTLPSDRPVTRGRPIGHREDRAAVLPQRWPRASSLWRWDRTQADQSGSPRRCAASSASSLPTVVCRGMVSSPSRRHWTR